MKRSDRMALQMSQRLTAKIPNDINLIVLILFSVVFTSFPRVSGEHTVKDKPYHYLVTPANVYIRNSMSDILENTWNIVDEVEHIKQRIHNTPPFEVGYIYQIIHDKYRKMVDKYKTVQEINVLYYVFEYIVYLEEIEHGYWQLDHLLSMAHEIERKYDVQGKQWKDLTREEEEEELLKTTNPTLDTPTTTKTSKKSKIHDTNPNHDQSMNDEIMNEKMNDDRYKVSGYNKTRWWWPKDYGWEIDTYW